MIQPVCEECSWRGASTYDLREAQASCRQHSLEYHFALIEPADEPP